MPVLVVKLEAEAADLEATVAGLLADAETTDAAEDARYGVAGKDADLPAELDRREKRLARLQAARAQIEAEAAAKARARAEETERRRQAARTGPASPMSPKSRRRARPKPKAQANFTDPDHAS